MIVAKLKLRAVRVCMVVAFAATVAAFALSACNTHSYDTGDGGNSYLQAHFAEVHTASNGAHTGFRAVTTAQERRKQAERSR